MELPLWNGLPMRLVFVRRCEQARKWSTVPWIIDGVLVYVSDLDQHFKQAKAAGATILSEIEGGFPGRRFGPKTLKDIAGFSLRRSERLDLFAECRRFAKTFFSLFSTRS